MLVELALHREVDKHTSRIVIADVEDADGTAVVTRVDCLGRPVEERDGGEAAAWIQGDCELFTVHLHHAGDRTAFNPNLTIVFRVSPEIGSVEALDLADELSRSGERVGKVAASRGVG